MTSNLELPIDVIVMIRRAAHLSRLGPGEYLRHLVRADVMLDSGWLPEWARPTDASAMPAEERQS